MLAKSITINTTLSSDAAAGLPVLQDSALDWGIIAIVGRRGLRHWVNSDNRVAGGVIDEGTGQLWSFVCGSAEPAVSTISGRPGMRQTHGVSRHLSGPARVDGFFSIVG